MRMIYVYDPTIRDYAPVELTREVALKCYENMEASVARLKKCPFCGGDFKFQLTDEEGNFRDKSYLNDPYSGIGYVVTHPVPWDSCPIATEDGETLGHIIYERVEEAVDSMNERFTEGSEDA